MLDIPNLFSSEELSRIEELIDSGRFVDGRWTAGGQAAKAKNNLLLDLEGDELDRIVVDALCRNPRFKAYVRPCRFAPLMVNRYQQGMSYGEHIDGVIMGKSPPMRCDLSVTIFLSDPASYEGGELVVVAHAGRVSVKLPPGTALVYPSGSFHHVEPVREGSRTAIVTWVQSFVRDGEVRDMLFDLKRAIDLVESGKAEDAAHLLIKTEGNLYRKFATP